MARGTERPEWRDGFLFVGNELALDFLNTRPVQNGAAQELLPDFDAVLRWFEAAKLLNAQEQQRLRKQWSGKTEAAKTTEKMREWREGLRKEVVAWENGGGIGRAAVEELNGLLRRHPMVRKVKPDGKMYRMEEWFELKEPADLFAPVARSAAKLFTDLDRGRVRKCDQCVLHFYDTSKKGTRRWCSMQLCGNRLKVAAYAARKSGH